MTSTLSEEILFIPDPPDFPSSEPKFPPFQPYITIISVQLYI